MILPHHNQYRYFLEHGTNRGQTHKIFSSLQSLNTTCNLYFQTIFVYWIYVSGIHCNLWSALRKNLEFVLGLFCFYLEKEMAPHSSTLAWRIPGMVEPGGLPSMGSHRVRHDWSDLAAAAAAFYQMFLQPKANSGNLTNPIGEKKSLSGYEATLAYAVVCQIHFSPEPFVPPGVANVGCSQLCPCPGIALSWREPSCPVRSTLGAACIQLL